jgi:hypothetical protein
MTAPFTDHREAARAILLPALQGSKALRAKEGQFLGGLAFDANPLTEKQANWLCILLDKHGLPPLAGDDQ